MARRTRRKRRPVMLARVQFRGLAYEMNVGRCVRTMVLRQAAGELSGIEDLADKVDVSRSTISRFFAGKPGGMVIVARILSALELTFEDVFREVEDDDE